MAKQWYDYERSTFQFVKQLKCTDSNEGIVFEHEQDFDENGILYWIGTNAKWVLTFLKMMFFSIIYITYKANNALEIYERITCSVNV